MAYEALICVIKRDGVSDLDLFVFFAQGDPLCGNGVSAVGTVPALGASVLDADETVYVGLIGFELGADAQGLLWGGQSRDF